MSEQQLILVEASQAGLAGIEAEVATLLAVGGPPVVGTGVGFSAGPLGAIQLADGVGAFTSDGGFNWDVADDILSISGRLDLTSLDGAEPSAVLRRVAGQTADILQIRGDADEDLGSIDAEGRLRVGPYVNPLESFGIEATASFIARDSTDFALWYESYGPVLAGITGMGGTRRNGTWDAPLPHNNGDVLFGLFAGSYDLAGDLGLAGSVMWAAAEDAPAAGNMNTKLHLAVHGPGSGLFYTTRMSIDELGHVGFGDGVFSGNPESRVIIHGSADLCPLILRRGLFSTVPSLRVHGWAYGGLGGVQFMIDEGSRITTRANVLPDDGATGDEGLKQWSVQWRTSAPTACPYIQFQNGPGGGGEFYLVLRDGVDP